MSPVAAATGEEAAGPRFVVFTGMMSGMVTGMWLAMDSLSFPFALVVGGFAGFVTIVAVWILNNQIDGIQGNRADG